MRQIWRHVLFLHWEMPAEQLQPFVPEGLVIDTFEGAAYVGLVPFTMAGVRPLWAPPIWGLSSFHEVNVRTYVRDARGEAGVWFFSLDAANPIAVHLARRFWHLPYYHARMRMTLRDGGPLGTTIDSESHRVGATAGCRLSYSPHGPAAPAAPGTREHFLVERYLLFARGPSGLWRGRVHHEPYRVQAAALHAWEESLLAAAGIRRPAGEPLAHYSAEVRVRVDPPERQGS